MTTDLKKLIPSYSAPRGRFEVVTVPPLQHLMVDGRGEPGTSRAYQDALGALYPVAYALKKVGRAEVDQDHVVMPLEGLWWSEDMDTFTRARDPSRWDWTLMICVPGWVAAEHVARARQEVARRREAPALDAVRLETLDEGLCVQTLHVGSYDDEGPVLERMHDEVIPARSLRMTGKHHEIYLSDARRTPPERLRTILRQPVSPVTA